MCHSDLNADLQNLPNWIPKWNYPSSNDTLQSEWGSIQNIRVMMSSEGAIIPNASLLGNDVYPMFITGLQAYATVEQDNFSSRLIYRDRMYSDGLAQNITLGYTMATVPKVLNDLWIGQVRVTLS